MTVGAGADEDHEISLTSEVVTLCHSMAVDNVVGAISESKTKSSESWGTIIAIEAPTIEAPVLVCVPRGTARSMRGRFPYRSSAFELNMDCNNGTII